MAKTPTIRSVVAKQASAMSGFHLHGDHRQNVQQNSKRTGHCEDDKIDHYYSVGLCGKVLWNPTDYIVDRTFYGCGRRTRIDLQA